LILVCNCCFWNWQPSADLARVSSSQPFSPVRMREIAVYVFNDIVLVSHSFPPRRADACALANLRVAI